MSEPRLADYLVHIEEAARDSVKCLSGMSKGDFKANGEKQAAVLLKMIVIGEAATRILQRHPEFIDLHPEMPWRGMRAMRNHSVHGYFKIDYDLVWDAISDAMPSLIARLPSVREELDGRERDSGA